MFSPDNSPRQKKKNCKYRRQICKSVQTFYAKVVCPTFWDDHLLKLLFSPRAFSLTTAMQILMFEKDLPY